MRRGDFEDLLRKQLDSELVPRGFQLVPQPPADWNDEKPAAVYEANPDHFGERYPQLDPRPHGNAPCVDLWVHLDPSTGLITSELEGRSVEDLMERFGLNDPAEQRARLSDVDGQVTALARRWAAILDAASAP